MKKTAVIFVVFFLVVLAIAFTMALLFTYYIGGGETKGFRFAFPYTLIMTLGFFHAINAGINSIMFFGALPVVAIYFLWRAISDKNVKTKPY